MRSDRIPDVSMITVSGYSGWDLGDVRTMGLMARFHEIDREGKRLNKIMLLGDDDWHQPGGKQALRWRAVSFSPREETRRLNLYCIRLISSSGTLNVADYQVRCDDLADSDNVGKSIRRFDFSEDEDWNADKGNLALLQNNTLELRPEPHTNTHAESRTFDIRDIGRIAFSVEMDMAVPERYNDHDPSHKVWMSTYLELLDDASEVVDVVKISVCRPEFGSSLSAAGEVPEGVTKARFRLVGSHVSYLPAHMKENMDGEITCRWRNLSVFQCNYPMHVRQRLDEDGIKAGEIPPGDKVQIRALLLGDATTESPVLNDLRLTLK